jgi:hypothetical protein
MQGLSIFLLVPMKGDMMEVFVAVAAAVAKLKLECLVGIGIGKPTKSVKKKKQASDVSLFVLLACLIWIYLYPSILSTLCFLLYGTYMANMSSFSSNSSCSCVVWL